MRLRCILLGLVALSVFQSGCTTSEHQFEIPFLIKQMKCWYFRETARGPVYKLLLRGDRTQKKIMLTFDDGPHQNWTPQLLAILKAHNVKATFFVVGEQASKYPELVRAQVRDGHVVANHSEHHVRLSTIPYQKVVLEYAWCNTVLKRITGEQPRYCRPPGGDYNREIVLAASRLGLTTVLWTADPGDYANPGERAIEKKLLLRVKNGGIILLHDGIQETLDVLPHILQTLKADGYEFVLPDDFRAARKR